MVGVFGVFGEIIARCLDGSGSYGLGLCLLFYRTVLLMQILGCCHQNAMLVRTPTTWEPQNSSSFYVSSFDEREN